MENIIETLNAIEMLGYGSNDPEFHKDCKKIRKELEFRTGKEPVNTFRHNTIGYCPVCGKNVTNQYKFCSECGQKLKWRDVK